MNEFALLDLILASKAVEAPSGGKALYHRSMPDKYICQNGYGDILIYSTVGADDIIVKADIAIQTAYTNMIRRVEG